MNTSLIPRPMYPRTSLLRMERTRKTLHPAVVPAGFKLLLTSCFGALLFGQTTREHLYENVRYGYQVFAPAELIKEPQAAGDLALRSRDGHLNGIIHRLGETRPGFPGNDPEGEGRATSADCDHLPASYTLRKPAMVAFSCEKNHAIRYTIIRYTASGSVSLDATYPVAERSRWDGIVSKMAASLKRTR